MTSIFEGQPLKTRPKFQAKEGSFGLQVYIHTRIQPLIMGYCPK